MRTLLLSTALLGGCVFGTDTVGVWAPRRVVDTEVCIEEAPGTCARTAEVARDLPARRFAGVDVSFANPGYATLSRDGHRESAFALHNHFEYFRGRSRYALGLRVGANIDIGADKLALFAVPVSLVGHAGTQRASFYAGLGYAPYASLSVEIDDVSERRTSHGPQAIAGARYVLATGPVVQFTASLDLVHQRLDDVSATSATTGLGIHF